MIGKYVIVRTYSAGVHLGTLKSLAGTEAVLENARRLWYWKGAFTLTEASLTGVKDGSKLSETVPSILLTQAIEILPVSAGAQKDFEERKAYKP